MMEALLVAQPDARWGHRLHLLPAPLLSRPDHAGPSGAGRCGCGHSVRHPLGPRLVRRALSFWVTSVAHSERLQCAWPSLNTENRTEQVTVAAGRRQVKMGPDRGASRWRDLEEDGISLLFPWHFPGAGVCSKPGAPASPTPHTARGPRCCVLVVGGRRGLTAGAWRCVPPCTAAEAAALGTGVPLHAGMWMDSCRFTC